MTIGNILTAIGLFLTALAMLGGVVRWALRVEIKQTITTHVETLTESTLKPLQVRLDALANAAARLADQMNAAQIAHKEERGELHDGLLKLREFLERLDSRVDEHSERLAVIEAMRDQPTPKPPRKPRMTARKV